jgi:hypothetical protein
MAPWLLAWLWLIAKRRHQAAWPAAGLLTFWMIVTWIAMVFIPLLTVAHAGSYLIPMLLYPLLLAGILLASRWLFAITVAVQTVFFVLTWLPMALP